jgi:hypothetical protein
MFPLSPGGIRIIDSVFKGKWVETTNNNKKTVLMWYLFII